MSGDAPRKVPHAVHLRRPSRLEGGQGRVPDRFPAPSRGRDDLSGRRHRRRLAAAPLLALAAERTTTWCRSCCARRARARSIIYIAGNHDEFLRAVPGHAFRRHRRRRPRDPRDRRRPAASWSSMATSSTRSSTMRAGSPISATAPTTPPCVVNRLVTRRAPPVRPALLVVLVLGQGQGQEGGELHRRVPEDADRGSAPQRRRRRHLRPYPPCRDRALRGRRNTSTPATGSKAARRSSSISTARMENPCTGRMPCAERSSVVARQLRAGAVHRKAASVAAGL